jgi:hypothetical protein
MIHASRIWSRRSAFTIALALLTGCGGAFGVGNTTNPGSTSNIPPQSGFRVIGDVGTPFVARVSDANASWTIYGTIPESIVIVNPAPPSQIIVTKLANDSRLLSLQLIGGLTVRDLSSTTENYGSVAGELGGFAQPFAPPASPDVRFFVKGPSISVFDATIESRNLNTSNILQSRVPAMLLLDLAGDSPDRVDGIFNQVTALGPFDINLIINGNVLQTVGGTTASIKGDT